VSAITHIEYIPREVKLVVLDVSEVPLGIVSSCLWRLSNCNQEKGAIVESDEAILASD
jgi:hypothetical protein